MVLRVILVGLLLLTPAVAEALCVTGQDQEPAATGTASDPRLPFEASLQANPGDAAALAGEVQASERLALDARRHGDYDAALNDLVRAQKFAPENPRLLYDLGVLDDEMKLYWDADKVLAHAAQLQPDEPKILYAIARVKLDLGQLAPAEQQMRAYLKLQPDDASAHYGLGHILQMAQQPEEARKEFARSVALQPRQTESYYQLGQIALENGQYDEALTQFAKTLARDSRHGGALTGTGMAYFRQKQYDKAEASLEKAVGAAPDYQPAHYYLGLTMARLGRKADSDRELALATRMADEQNKQSAQRMRINP